ncbi:MAG: UvrB/UvrC motif-containing protein [Armatimonadetes bacterium]|nr:UvrB/UvrC motif-containing protein [Armatimonadota bacterium]
MTGPLTIAPILDSWELEPGAQSIRVVPGLDGHAKLQVRVDLGLLQLEMDGRPDGACPHGHSSLLDFHTERLEDYRRSYGSVDGFRINSSECKEICDEASLYYHRYISLHQIGRFLDVARDTARNLRAVDFLSRYAAAREDSWPLEQYRPYITMMNALARASTHLSECDHAAAERVLATAMAAVRHFGGEHVGQVDVTGELDILGQRLRDVQSERPKSELDLLQRRLSLAVEREDYEQAAGLRDRLRHLSGPEPAGFNWAD